MPELQIVALAFAAGLVVSLTCTPFVIRMAWRLLALDRPDSRKVHVLPVPRVGGISVMLGFLAGVGLPLAAMGYGGSLFGAVRYHWIAWIGAIAALFVCGLVDDLRGLPPLQKLAVQTGGALAVFAAGFKIEHVRLPVLGDLDLSWTALPLTILWIVGVTNAVNLIDGLDGLATGICFLVTATLGAIAYYEGVLPVTVIALALAGSLLGFLPYNVSPARIFLGDSGSQFLGFTLAVISIRGMHKSATVVAILVPILALGLPILDTLLVMLRRTWSIQRDPESVGLRTRVSRSRGVFRADREHIHHNLLDLGLSQRRAVLVLYVVAAVFCVAAFALVALRDPTLALVLGVSVALATIVIKALAVRRRTYAPPSVVRTLPTGGARIPAEAAAAAPEAAPAVRSLGGGRKC